MIMMRENENVQITRAQSYTRAVSARTIFLQKYIFNAFLSPTRFAFVYMSFYIRLIITRRIPMLAL